MITQLSNKNSKPVRSAQVAVHPRVQAVVQRHLLNLWQLRPHGPSVVAFKALENLLQNNEQRPLIFDAGCGTGQSTRDIAATYPDCWVIGIDRSDQRLARTGTGPFPRRSGNAVWIRAELATFWYLARQAGWSLSRHYLLYPNPWPKASQLRRRWHGHPVFPILVQLGGVLEMRCNWEVYAQEFATALGQVCQSSVAVEELQSDPLSSPFETKYRNSGIPLFRVQVDLGR